MNRNAVNGWGHLVLRIKDSQIINLLNFLTRRSTSRNRDTSDQAGGLDRSCTTDGQKGNEKEQIKATQKFHKMGEHVLTSRMAAPLRCCKIWIRGNHP